MQVVLAPIRVANTLPSPLLAVLKMNSQAITQYCKVHGASREAVPGPAQHCVACLHTCTRRLPVGMAAEGSPSDKATAVNCASLHEDVPGEPAWPHKQASFP